MIITRYDFCGICGDYIMVEKDFAVTLNMFDPQANGITPEIRKQIIAWRDRPIFCDLHAYVGLEAVA